MSATAKPHLLIWPLPERGPEGRPMVGIETRCPHATITTTYESDTDDLGPEARGTLIGRASQLHDEQLPCDCFRNNARVRVGMPPEWANEGIGPRHRRYLDA